MEKRIIQNLKLSEELYSFYKDAMTMASVRAGVIIISFLGSIIPTRSIGADGRGGPSLPHQYS